MNINWYPGHMAKTRRQLEEDLSGVDAVIELFDARAAASSRNPDLEAMCGGKPRLLVLGRADLADPAVTALWQKVLPGSAAVNAASPGASKAVLPALRKLLAERIRRDTEKGQAGRPLRVIVIGVPNTGKSTLINTLLRRRAAKAEDRPGVTRSRGWFSMERGFLLMDTPGMLWPKFEDTRTGFHLAFTGAIRDEIMDTETLAARLIDTLEALYPGALGGRYGTAGGLEALAERRGYLLPGGVPDTGRMALALLDDFRAGKLGRISLERPE
ncbi:MAG: ribosome biogenesis GTPase YlqF [Oscillospiraceae bacterium]|jgi:ribosome biogenesis GTPase A|nr:ribosome biogenesis GTPase YlqF [Oscillospiraceae bacterium]